MTQEPTNPNIVELERLLWQMRDDGLDAEGQARLESLVIEDAEARRFYIRHGLLCGGLRWLNSKQTCGAIDEASPIPETPAPWPLDSKPWIPIPDSEPAPMETPMVVPSLSPTPTSLFLPSVFFSYAIAAVIVGIGLTLAAFTYVSQPTDIAQLPNNSNPQSLIPNPSAIVARITGTADCRWEKKGLGIRDWELEEGSRSKVQGSRSKVQGSRSKQLQSRAPKSLNPQIPKSLVCLGDQFILSAGLMEITYNSGAKVILQGPCTFEVDSAAGGFLEVGKLTARVEQSTKYGVRSTEQVASGKWLVASDKMQNEKCKLQNAKLANAKSPNLQISKSLNLQISKSLNPQIPKSLNPLFAVRTPTATITDLGTEFGVEVDKAGDTTSHVFQGSVRVQTVAADGKTLSEARILRENESAHVERRGDANPIVALHTFTPSQLHTFVRELPKPRIQILDLLDVVAGGNGSGNHREQGIDPTTGARASAYVYPIENRGAIAQYHPITWNPLIDGVFTPNGKEGPVQLDSIGHTFDGFGSEGVPWSTIWAYAAARQTGDSPVHFIPHTRGLLEMHPCKGITFDLDGVRNTHTGMIPARFRATAGVAHPDGLVTFRVFVDGQVRFRRFQMCHANGPVPIDVQIKPGDRFLSLASEYGKSDPSGGWLILGDPRLELMETSRTHTDNIPERKENER